MTMLPSINNGQMPFVSEYDERNSDVYDQVEEQMQTEQEDDIHTIKENENS